MNCFFGLTPEYEMNKNTLPQENSCNIWPVFQKFNMKKKEEEDSIQNEVE